MDVKGFVIRFFAVVGLLLSFTLGLAFWGMVRMFSPALPQAAQAVKVPETMVLDLDLTQKLAEQTRDFRLSLPALLEDQGDMPYFTLVRAIHRAKDDPRVKAIVARIGTERPPFVYVQELATALRAFRDSGKSLYVFAPSYGDFGPGGGGIYALASQFDQIWLQPVGAVGLTGPAMEAPFGKTALAKLGIEGDFMRRDDFKSAMENVTNDAFSAPVKANMKEMLGSLEAALRYEIAQGRKVEDSVVAGWMKDGPFTAQEALKAGLVSKIGYEDEMLKEAQDKAGKDSELVAPQDYLTYAPAKATPEPKAKVAVIYAEGMIVDQPSRLVSDGVIDTANVVQAFDDAREDESIRAILFRVNSPGGSPVASETIRRAMIRAKEAGKPVFVSMGSVAASGGYWISMNADRIVADPATITGSIGVVAGKFVLGGLFDKLGIGWDGVGESEAAQMLSPRAPFSPKARERMNALLDETYKAFTDNVAAARKIDPAKMPDLAKGRVYTGAQAIEAGLVDELGGMQEAIDGIKIVLKLQTSDKVELVQLPAPETAETMLIKALQNLRSGGAMIADLTQMWRQVRASLGPVIEATQMRGGVQMRYEGGGAY